MQKPRILAIVGPTASGKSALAVALAGRLGGEIVSCDSMQVYRGMDIGTAKPTEAEKGGVRHWLLDIAEPEQAFSAGDYILAANAAVEDVLSRGRLPIFCGGTGLYLDAFLRGGLPETPPADEQLRAALNARAAQEGPQVLYRELCAVDPASAAATHANNLRRVIRALEIYRLTGVPKSEWDRRSTELPSKYDACVIGLRFASRALLYERINARVDAMLAQGLECEVRALAERGVFTSSATAAGAIGYKELLPYLAGACTREQAVEELKTATRRYAKRQLTWFSAKSYVRWLEADEAGQPRNFEKIVNNACEIFEQRL